MKKGTILEVFNKILYDRNIDPADFEVIFIDSGKLRCVPFTYLTPQKDGFKYRGNFYPFYKIVAIRNSKTGKYLLKRGFHGFIEGDLGIELYDYPVYLPAIYDEFALHRYASEILRHIEYKVKKTGNIKEWMKSLGKLRKLSLDGVELYVIIEEGAFRGSFFLLVNNEPLMLIRSIPSPIVLSKIFERVKFHRVIIQRLKGSLIHLFRVDSHLIKISNVIEKVEFVEGQSSFIKSYPANISLFFSEMGNERKLIGACDQKLKIFLRFDKEVSLAKRHGFELARCLARDLRVKDLLWFELDKDAILKIQDVDVIFAVLAPIR